MSRARTPQFKPAKATAKSVAGRANRAQKLARQDPLTCDRIYTSEEDEFRNAVQAYKAKHGIRFLADSDYFRVLVRELGYVKGATPLAVNASA